MIDKANVGGTVHDINDTGARGMISPDVFSTAAAYEAGEYCIYNNTLYKFTEAKSAGAWDDSKASATDIASELSALNSSFESGVKIKNVIVVTRNITINSDYNAWEQLPYTFPTPLSDVYSGLTGAHPASGKTARFFVNPSGNLVCDTAITNEIYGSWSISGAYVGES